MKIRSKYTMVTAALIGAVVGLITWNVLRVQRAILEGESAERMNALMEGVERLAQEAAASRDQLMLVSYLAFLQREHPEMASATIDWDGHVSRLGRESPGLIVMTRKVFAKDLLSASPEPEAERTAPITFDVQGRSLEVSPVEKPRAKESALPRSVTVKIGILPEKLREDLDRALTPLLKRTVAIAAVFMILGMLSAVYLAKRLTGPLTTLAAAVTELGRGHLDVSVPPGSHDEVGALAGRFNEMTAHLRELIQLKEDLLHTLTHELNTPLGGVKGYLELLRDGKLPEENRKEAVHTMMSAVGRMESSLANVLDLFRSEHRQGDPKWLKVVWVDQVLREVISLFSPTAQSKRITMELTNPRAIGHVVADEEFVRQIATNLVSNSLKYTPEGGRVRVGVENAADSVTFWVKDTGPGIAAADMPHLFAKFDRLGEGSSSHNGVPGTGLGLSIAKKAVEKMGGRIWVESEAGKGASFYVSLPKTIEAKPEKQMEGV